MAKTKRVHKRRKVWVNDRDGVLSGTCEETRSDAEMLSGRPVPFLESRPGDVVLSREDVEACALRVVQALATTGPDEGRVDVAAAVIRGFRGGR